MECIFCKSTDIRELNSFNDYSICACNVCNTVFADQVADNKEYYFLSPKKSSGVLKQKLANSAKSITAEFYYNYLTNNLGTAVISSVLDIGADRGHLLRLFEKQGVKAVGIEADRIRAANPVASDLRVGFFDEDYVLDERFNLVCFTQNMSYFRDNRSILKKASSLLNGGGYIFIATVNGDSPMAVKHFSKYGNPNNCACILSKKGWSEICDLFEFDLLDYSFYEPPMLKDIVSKRWFRLPQYMICPSKAYYRTDINGHHALILLKRRKGV